MNINCPTCSKVLSIPASAAGKVVKCPCGQQLKAPPAAGGSAPANVAAKAKSTPAAQPKPAAQPAASAPAQPPSDSFDQLTEDDYRPLTAVSNPGAKSLPPEMGENARKLLSEAADDGKGKKRKRRKKKKGSASAGGERRSFPGAIACFVLTVLSIGGAGFMTYKRLQDSTFADEAVVIIGMFLLPVIFLVVGVVLMGRKK